VIATLPGGVKLDMLTADELRDVLMEVASGFYRGPATFIDEMALQLDGSGNGTTMGWKVAPAGMEFALHRMVVDLDPGASTNYSVGAPYTNAAGYILIRRAGKLQDFFSLASSAGGIPAVYTSSHAQSIRFKNNHPLNVQVVGGPASGTLIFRVQGTQQPVTVS
jgi:hypothetical protein